VVYKKYSVRQIIYDEYQNIVKEYAKDYDKKQYKNLLKIKEIINIKCIQLVI
jgi:hypothetical protein